MLSSRFAAVAALATLVVSNNTIHAIEIECPQETIIYKCPSDRATNETCWIFYPRSHELHVKTHIPIDQHDYWRWGGVINVTGYTESPSEPIIMNFEEGYLVGSSPRCKYKITTGDEVIDSRYLMNIIYALRNDPNCRLISKEDGTFSCVVEGASAK